MLSEDDFRRLALALDGVWGMVKVTTGVAPGRRVRAAARAISTRSR